LVLDLEDELQTRRTFTASLSLLGLLPLAVSARAQQSVPSRSVIASFSVLADLCRNVGGDRLAVTPLVGPNGDAHVYQPSPADGKSLAAATLIVVNGLGLEGWMNRLIQASGAKAPVIVAANGINQLKIVEGGHLTLDPHAWQSVANAKIYVANIEKGLISADPEGTSIYSANAKAYQSELDTLEEDVKAAIRTIPPDRRRIITTHDAFGYFGAAYGFQFIAPEGVSTEAEPSARDVAKIIRQIKTEKIPAVFLENVTDARMVQRIAQDSGATIGGTLFSDALSPPDGPATTYIDMMRHNVRQLSKALTGA
jgi:zinc/manganese transport system substrate-binding protein